MAAVSIGSQQWYKDSTSMDPQGFVAWMMDALHKGGRLIENAPEDVANGNPKYATYAQIYANLQAFHPEIAQQLPTPDMVKSNPVVYKGLVGGDVFQSDEQGAAAPVPAPAPTAPATPAPDPAADQAQQQRMNVFNTLSQTLDSLGMGELFKMPGPDGTNMAPGGGNAAPSGWLWDQIIAGTVNDQASLNMALEKTPVWQRLFGDVINGQRAAAKKDPTTVHIMTPAELAAYRQVNNQLARQFNLPTNFYDDVHDWDALAIGQVDPTEVRDRIVNGWNDVANADPNVQAAFNAYHGINSAQEMAAFFLDPSHSLANLELSAQEAVIGGTGARYGFGLERPLAERIARNGVTQIAAQQQFGALQQAAGFFRQNVGEAGGDLTNEAIANQFGVSPTPGTDVTDLERRRTERIGTTTAATGGPTETRRGIAGVGAQR